MASIRVLSVDSSGVITAQFSNGRTSTIGQIAVATVANTAGLTVSGGNNFSTSAASGLATVGVAGIGGRGTLDDGALEQSNVNICTEFSDLIVGAAGVRGEFEDRYDVRHCIAGRDLDGALDENPGLA